MAYETSGNGEMDVVCLRVRDCGKDDGTNEAQRLGWQQREGGGEWSGICRSIGNWRGLSVAKLRL